ncbi:hypothetical protein [Streptomyces sp. 8N706]|uniref:hypothetical protein n=1 Tax=Streptomyces sp. 8N706 TaxID=3457416 RepID=UPI003FD04116
MLGTDLLLPMAVMSPVGAGLVRRRWSLLRAVLQPLDAYLDEGRGSHHGEPV